MKLYTRSGDDGSTGLFGGSRVGKDDLRVEAYGTVDELNTHLGLVLAAMPGRVPLEAMYSQLVRLQSLLFDLGADLATPAGSEHEDKVARVDEAVILQMEAWIDEIDGANLPMKTFVLPGGTELSARLHVARTVCRRAERRVIALGRVEEVNPVAVVLLNRLSDLLFAMARRANLEAGVADVAWQKGDAVD